MTRYSHDALNRVTEVIRGNGTKSALTYDEEDHVTRIVNICGSCGKEVSSYSYKYNEQSYIISEEASEVLIPESQRTEKGDSPKEELASLIKGGVKAKGYTLTEYVNDVNWENTQVLAEYSAEDILRQAYTYGEEGTGERTAVAKSGESNYYLYDGRGSVTGVLTEKGTLTNSYRYDAYGNLTSGTPEAVNYYGYNGESANVKTGFQYLRARYYYAENGTFTTEDSDLGTKENPLTRNRYSYVMNNPLNYADPTGHRAKAASGIGRAGAVVKSIGNIVKTVTNVVKAVAGVAMAVGSIHAQAAQTGGTKGQTRGTYQSGYVPSGRSTGGLSYIQYMSKIVMQQMKVVLCTNQRQKVSGASATAIPALPSVIPWLEKAGEVLGAIILGIFFYEGTKEDKDSKDSLEGWGG